MKKLLTFILALGIIIPLSGIAEELDDHKLRGLVDIVSGEGVDDAREVFVIKDETTGDVTIEGILTAQQSNIGNSPTAPIYTNTFATTSDGTILASWIDKYGDDEHGIKVLMRGANDYDVDLITWPNGDSGSASILRSIDMDSEASETIIASAACEYVAEHQGVGGLSDDYSRTIFLGGDTDIYIYTENFSTWPITPALQATLQVSSDPSDGPITDIQVTPHGMLICKILEVGGSEFHHFDIRDLDDIKDLGVVSGQAYLDSDNFSVIGNYIYISERNADQINEFRIVSVNDVLSTEYFGYPTWGPLDTFSIEAYDDSIGGGAPLSKYNDNYYSISSGGQLIAAHSGHSIETILGTVQTKVSNWAYSPKMYGAFVYSVFRSNLITPPNNELYFEIWDVSNPTDMILVHTINIPNTYTIDTDTSYAAFEVVGDYIVFGNEDELVIYKTDNTLAVQRLEADTITTRVIKADTIELNDGFYTGTLPYGGGSDSMMVDGGRIKYIASGATEAGKMTNTFVKVHPQDQIGITIASPTILDMDISAGNFMGNLLYHEPSDSYQIQASGLYMINAPKIMFTSAASATIVVVSVFVDGVQPSPVKFGVSEINAGATSVYLSGMSIDYYEEGEVLDFRVEFIGGATIDMVLLGSSPISINRISP